MGVLPHPVDELVQDRPGHPLQRRLALVGRAEFVRRDAEPVPAILGQIGQIAMLDQDRQQPIGGRSGEPEAGGDAAAGEWLRFAGKQGQHVEDSVGGG